MSANPLPLSRAALPAYPAIVRTATTAPLPATVVTAPINAIIARRTLPGASGVLANLTAYRPLQPGGSYAPFSKTAVTEQVEEDPRLGPGIRINRDDDNLNGVPDRNETNVAGENDLIEVRLQATGPNYVLQRSDGNLRVWTSATKGSEIAFTNNQSAPLTTAAGSSAQQTVWVEWAGTGPGTSRLTLKSLSTGLPQDSLVFHTFQSLTIVFGGETYGISAISPNAGIMPIGTQLYGEGYDVRLHREDEISAAYDEVWTAIACQGVPQIAIMGYSHGGGSTYILADQLNRDRNSIGSFKIAFTAYVDAVENLSNLDTLPQTHRPPGSGYHVNYYQHLDRNERPPYCGGPTSPLGTGYQVDVETQPWGAGATHLSIVSLPQVRSGIHDRLVQRMTV